MTVTPSGRLLLEARAIEKRYDAVVALDGANLELQRGEVMGIVGDNGAGKSTLVKVIAGTVTPNRGVIAVAGRPVELRKPIDALELGIETVYQDLALVEPMTALQNIFLGREVLHSSLSGRLLRLIDRKAMRRRASEILVDLGIKIPSLDEKVQRLSGGQRQSIALARALLWGREIVILDEPTAALGVNESEHTLEIIGRLKEHGVSVIIVSHNLQHLWTIADRITVLRLGKTVGVRVVAETTPEQIVSLITGGALVGTPSPQSRRSAGANSGGGEA